MKRPLSLTTLLLTIAVVLWLALAAPLVPIKTRPAKKVLANPDLAKILVSPRRYRGRPVDLYGQIAADPEYDGKGTHLQVYLLFGRRDTFVVVDYPAVLEVTQGDVINIKGRVGPTFKGVTDNGDELFTFRVAASKISAATAEKVLAPAGVVWRTRVVKVEQDVEVTVGRVEFSAGETRFYIKMRNRRPEAIVTHVFNSAASQNGKTLSLQPNQMADYDEVSVDLPGGAQDTGVLVFPTMAPERPIDLALSISGADWESSVHLELKPPRNR